MSQTDSKTPASDQGASPRYILATRMVHVGGIIQHSAQVIDTEGAYNLVLAEGPGNVRDRLANMVRLANLGADSAPERAERIVAGVEGES